MRVKRTRYPNIVKKCPKCNSSRISSDGFKFRCDKCGFVNVPGQHPCKFVTYVNYVTDKELNLDK